jgi:hypothetical protein
LPNPDTNQYTLVFPVSLAPLATVTYFIDMRKVTTLEATPANVNRARRSSNAHRYVSTTERYESGGVAANDIVVGNAHVRLTYDGSTFLLKSLDDLIRNVTLPLEQNFVWYNESAGNNKLSTQGLCAIFCCCCCCDGPRYLHVCVVAGGAYIFRPNRSEPFAACTDAGACQAGNHPLALDVQRGPWLSSVRQVWGRVGSSLSWVSQTTRIYAGRADIELSADIGPVPIADADGKNVVSRFVSSLASADSLYTDAQGQEMQHRRLNQRPSWHLKVNEPVAGNYYPKNAAAYIEDSKTRLTLVTDRSSGVASLRAGELEHMLHRRLLHDDHRGVGEPLNETEAIRATSLLIVDAPDRSSRRQRKQRSPSPTSTPLSLALACVLYDIHTTA